MEENKHSETALKTACYRAYHSRHDNPKIIDDYLAAHLLGEEELTSHEELMVANFKSAAPEFAASFADDSAILTFMMQTMAGPSLIFSRARYAEDCLEEAIRNGAEQYVILGAGLDSFTFRKPEVAEKMQIFEIDHPASQSFKARRLSELGWDKPKHLHLIPADFNRDNLAAVLIDSSYNPNKKTFFSWLGVTYYLPRNAIFSTLKSITEFSCSGSQIVFDYLNSDAFIPENSPQRVQFMLLLAQQIGEPMITGFDSSILGDELALIGLRLNENLSPSDIQDRYFKARTDNYYACEHAHFASAVVE